MAVSDESVDVAIVAGTIVSRNEPPDELRGLLQSAARQVRSGEVLRSQGVSGGQAR